MQVMELILVFSPLNHNGFGLIVESSTRLGVGLRRPLCHACAIFLLERMGAKVGLCPPYLHSIFGQHQKSSWRPLIPPPDSRTRKALLYMPCWLQPVFLMSLNTTPLFWYLSIALKIYRKFYRFIIITFLE